MVDDDGSVLASSSPVRELKNGMASTTITASARRAGIRGLRPSPSAQRSQKPPACSTWHPRSASILRSARRSTFGPAAIGTGSGITGMRERATALGGDLSAGFRRGGGFRVSARLPVRSSR